MSAPLFLGDFWVIALHCIVAENGRIDAGCKVRACRRDNNNAGLRIRVEFFNDRG